uniref:Uncharacterized protein n=1 Tax=Medicago truncatula TaxID=3880 RepID=I3SFH6_MEDTR|nr:unknown [Medicago truncatula]
MTCVRILLNICSLTLLILLKLVVGLFPN